MTLTDAERERLWDVISRIRDAAPRRPDDASTDDIIDGIIDSGWVYDVLTARTPTATGDTGGLTVTRWGHARWFDPHPPEPVNVWLRPDGGTGTNPLMAECSVCHEVLLPATFAATGDDLRDRLTALVSDWQANAGSRALGDPTAATWDDAARQLLDVLAASSAPVVCQCPPCPGRGNDGHGMTHCAECCFGTGVEPELDCPTHGYPPYNSPAPVVSRPEAVVKTLEDFRDHGLRCDLNPTMRHDYGLYAAFVDYLRRADENVRARAARALEADSAAP